MQTNARLDCAEMLRAIGDETRLEVLKTLFDGPQHVGQINERLKIEQSLLSHHLKVLRDAALVVATREGKSVLYSLAPAIVRMGHKRVIDIGCCRLSFDD